MWLIGMRSTCIQRCFNDSGSPVAYRQFRLLKFVLARTTWRPKQKANSRFPFLRKKETKPKSPPRYAPFEDYWPNLLLIYHAKITMFPILLCAEDGEAFDGKLFCSQSVGAFSGLIMTITVNPFIKQGHLTLSARSRMSTEMQSTQWASNQQNRKPRCRGSRNGTHNALKEKLGISVV